MHLNLKISLTMVIQIKIIEKMVKMMQKLQKLTQLTSSGTKTKKLNKAFFATQNLVWLERTKMTTKEKPVSKFNRKNWKKSNRNPKISKKIKKIIKPRKRRKYKQMHLLENPKTFNFPPCSKADQNLIFQNCFCRNSMTLNMEIMLWASPTTSTSWLNQAPCHRDTIVQFAIIGQSTPVWDVD